MSINSLNVYISFLKLVKLYFQLKRHGSKFNVPCPSSNYLSPEQDIGLHIAISVIIFTIQLEVLKHVDIHFINFVLRLKINGI